MPLYTVREAAEVLGVTPDTVAAWIKSGKLRASKLGRNTMRISSDDIMELYDRNATRTKTPAESKEG